MYAIYNILYFIVLIVILPYQYFKRPSGLRNRWLRERLGFLPSYSSDSKPVWIHAVSVGEVIAAVPLLKGLKTSRPELDIVLSTVTDTGQAVAKERIGEFARIIYVPFDLPFAVANACRRVKPSLFIIMETELWPSIIRFFSRRGTPVLLLNGRLSESSVRGYRRLRFFMERVLHDISFFCMQNEEYAGRIISLGADKSKVRAIGNFKFDTRPSAPVPEWTRGLGLPVIVAGSTHRTEEDIILDAFVRLLSDYQSLVLVIAPRHPERFAEVEEIVKKRGIKYVKRSSLPSGLHGFRASGHVVILDVMGELASVYGAADIAVMGGSFVERGGQNPLEPAFWGKAVICGPHMENFPFIDDFYRHGAAARTGSEGLYETIREILDSPERMLSMGEAARNLYLNNAGATEKALRVIEEYL
ncbi:MAG TPA: 3-deoxy-D-manno-octulosonic acid transferase [Dissulfurispiraceae bacterium]|nr:3-deoxy-D-manno-octulosonic acid transferase [Dissulfurispiraceae bacterium]